MKPGKAFELLVERILINVGFSEVISDGMYVFDGSAGKMVQGLGEAHNADVLLEPPVQTPFYSRSRLLIECKDYSRKVGLNTVRSALGLREDINHFDIVDMSKLTARRCQRRPGIVHDFDRYTYQVAIAALEGYTIPAQNLAATYRIPLLEFNRMPFWQEFRELIGDRYMDEFYLRSRIIDFADAVGERMAVAITDSGQMLFLYCLVGKQIAFENYYFLHWSEPNEPWRLESGEQVYMFQLPDHIMKQWLNTASNELGVRREAMRCKQNFLSNMVVYYKDNGYPTIKMISIDENQLKQVKERL